LVREGIKQLLEDPGAAEKVSAALKRCIVPLRAALQSTDAVGLLFIT
jgi:hypothetical protein